MKYISPGIYLYGTNKKRIITKSSITPLLNYLNPILTITPLEDLILKDFFSAQIHLEYYEENEDIYPLNITYELSLYSDFHETLSSFENIIFASDIYIGDKLKDNTEYFFKVKIIYKNESTNEELESDFVQISFKTFNWMPIEPTIELLYDDWEDPYINISDYMDTYNENTWPYFINIQCSKTNNFSNIEYDYILSDYAENPNFNYTLEWYILYYGDGDEIPTFGISELGTYYIRCRYKGQYNTQYNENIITEYSDWSNIITFINE